MEVLTTGVLIQDCDIKQKQSFFTNTKKYLSEKVAPFLKKMKTMKENIQIIFCDNTCEINILETIA